MANLTKEERDVIDQIERAEEIYKNTIYTAQIEGERIGKIEGEQAKAIAVARSLLDAGMSISDISRHIGLAESEIRKLMH